MKKYLLIGALILVALVYLFAIWSASVARDAAARFSEESGAAMSDHAEWRFERPWAPRRGARDCDALQTLFEAGEASERVRDGAIVREAILEGRPLELLESESMQDRAWAVDAMRSASRCSRIETTGHIGVDRVDVYDWSRHLDLATSVAVFALGASPDACLKLGVGLSQLAMDASAVGGLAGLSAAELELRLAVRVIDRCMPSASNDALMDTSAGLEALIDADGPLWRSLVAQSLLVEKGASNAADDIHRFPVGPIELENAIFAGEVFEGWRRAIDARGALEATAREGGAVAAAERWEASFEHPDNKFDYVTVVAAASHMRAMSRARAELREMLVSIEALRQARAYDQLLDELTLGGFERRYEVD